ncbi:ABC transporter-related protein [Oleispira antarctica RB-8]|uniref:ABC transporter-related protein n=1 Tax=Oleispira antarctica RB-8 TaxID=698738 RepID=R4YQB6_OLEAN|nr:ABC transporter-related protein [Oleispira antarctica RB-8]
MLSFFEKLIKPFPSEDPQQPPSGVFAFCRHYSRGIEIPLILMTVLTATLAMLEVSLFSFMGQLVDWLATKDRATLWQEEGDTLITMGAIVLIALPTIVFLHAAIIHQTLLGNYPMVVRWLAHRYLLKQSLGFYQDEFSGRIATKVMQTSLAVRETVIKLLDVMVYVVVYFLSMLFIIAQADVRLMLPLMVWLVLYIALQYYFVPKLKAIATAQADARSTMTGRIVDSYSNIATVKLFSHTQREADYAQQGMQGFLTTVYQQMRLATGLNTSIHGLNYLLIFVISGFSIYLWQENAIGIGAITIAISLALRLNGMAQWIMWEVSALFENIGTVIDGMGTLSQPLQVTDVEDAKALVVNKGDIDFQNMNFSYSMADEEGNISQRHIIKNLNLHIKAGEKVGLVGRSGAGKSTLVSALMRFYDLESGLIKIDGQDIAKVQQETLRAHIAMVTQDTSLLHRSVRENILYGRPDATEEELQQAIRSAEAHEFIQELADLEGNTGLDAQVGERGVKLSGGQRQRIAIARVLLKDAPILILDEATSALDSEVEAAIQHSLYQLMEGKTVIAIAHRLSTIAAMDRLIVIDNGEIVEQGSHQELIAKQGIYAQLWAHQTGGFIADDLS